MVSYGREADEKRGKITRMADQACTDCGSSIDELGYADNGNLVCKNQVICKLRQTRKRNSGPQEVLDTTIPKLPVAASFTRTLIEEHRFLRSDVTQAIGLAGPGWVITVEDKGDEFITFTARRTLRPDE
jgi:hypothetical protein